MPIKLQQSSDPAFLFDLDGTLVDSVYEHVLAWSLALSRAEIWVPAWEIHRRIGMSGGALVRQILRGQKRDRNPDLKKLEKAHDAAFEKATETIRMLPGTPELLRYLDRSRLRWAIATTGGHKQTSRLLKIINLQPKVIVTGDDVAKAKPSPDVFVEAARRLLVPLDHCIVVGDSVWDVLAGGRRKALTVGLLSGGYSEDELQRAGAFRVYRDPADMLEHIEDLGLDRRKDSEN